MPLHAHKTSLSASGGRGEEKIFPLGKLPKSHKPDLFFPWASNAKQDKSTTLVAEGSTQLREAGWRDHGYLKPRKALLAIHVVHCVPGTCSHLRTNWELGLGGWEWGRVDAFTFQRLFETSFFLCQETQRMSKGKQKQKWKPKFFSIRNLNI